MIPVTVVNVCPRAIVDLCSSRGVPSDGLMAMAGVPPRLIAEPDARLSVQQALSLWSEAQKTTGEPLLADQVARSLPFGAYKIADYLLVTALTPRDALQKLIRCLPLINRAFELRLTPCKAGTNLELHNQYDSDEPSRLYVEFAFALIQHRLRFATGVDWHPKEVCFTHPPPSWSSDYHPTFQCRVRFQESVNRMVIEGDFLEMPLPHGDALLSEILGRHAQRLLNHSASDDGFLTDVRQVLSDGLSRGDVHLKTTANKLALSGRSLQRQLNSRGTSYKEELDRFRRDLALDLLGRQEIGDIVTLLRFSESRAFYRAFRRWTGKTPQEYMSILS